MSAQAERAHDRRVAFIGDSLVAGVGDPMGLGWVGRVVAASFGLGLPLTAYNLGVRRETSEQIAARWTTETVPRMLPGTDARVVLSSGANDTTVEDGQLRAPELSCAALAAILQDAAHPGRPVLVIGPAPVDDPEQNEPIRNLSAAFAEMCERAGAAFGERCGAAACIACLDGSGRG
jgi:acyl-CoA thioesterase-1